MKLLNNQGLRRLVLGFDAGCGMCSDLASRIAERVGDKLEVRSLYHPEIEHWRKQALREDAPWAPTLFEVDGIRGVRAWTGMGMAVKLTRALGPVSTWRVMQALGESGNQRVATLSEPSVRSVAVAGMSRGQFLKGIGGAAVAFSILSGATALPAQAVEDDLDYEGLARALSAIEEIPNSVIKRGDKAVKKWLRRRLKLDAQPGAPQQGISTQAFNASKCGWAIGVALVSAYFSAFKILKIRAAIKANGGVTKFISKFRAAFTAALGRRLSKSAAIKEAAISVGRVVVGAADAILDLFLVKDIYNNCF